jgi:hypothetical protein
MESSHDASPLHIKLELLLVNPLKGRI